MGWHRVVIRLLLSVAIVLAADWTAAAEDRSIVAPQALERAGYSVYWSATLPIAGGDRCAGAFLVDENLYVTTGRGRVYTIQADTGLLRWIQELGAYSSPKQAPTHVQNADGDGPVVFVTRSHVDMFDRYGGDLVRRIELPFTAAGGAVADQSMMYLGGTDGLLYALRWRCVGCGTPLVAWRSMLRGMASSTPVLTPDGRLYVAGDEGLVYCIQPPGRSLLWSYRTGGAIVGGLGVDESGVYVASRNRRLYILNPNDGAVVKSYRMPGPLLDGPIAAQRTVYQYCLDEGLLAFDSDTHEQLWQKRGTRAFVARRAEWLVLRTESGDLQIVDNQTGADRGAIDLPDGVLLATNTRDATLFAVSRDGRVLCAKRAGVPFLRREAVLTARARLHSRPRSQTAGVVSPNARPDSANQKDRTPKDPFRSTLGG